MAATHCIVVRSTFLDVEDVEATKQGASRVSSRASSEPPRSRPAEQLTVLEEATLSKLNALLDGSAQLQAPPRLTKETLGLKKPAVLKPALSSASISTMASESCDAEGCSGLRSVLSSSSISSMAWGDADFEEEEWAETAAVGSFAQWQATPQVDCKGLAVTHIAQRKSPKRLNFAEAPPAAASSEPQTTMMLRNIPNRYTQHELIEELEALGFAGSFDFLYAPTDFSTMGLLGYAFINFHSTDVAASCCLALEGYLFTKHQRKSTQKVASVSVAHLQGLQANLRHYEKSAVAARARARGCSPIVRPSLANTVFPLQSVFPVAR